MDVDEELEIMEDDEWTDSEEAEEEDDFEEEEEWEDDEFDEEDEAEFDEEDEADDDDDDDDEAFITREKVAGATNDFNSIYKEGAATARELKDAFDDIKDAFNFKDLFK